MTVYCRQLDKYCARSGYTRSGVSIAAGYNKNYVSNVINEKLTPTIEALEALATALNIPLAVLLFGDETDAITQEIISKLKGMDSTGMRAVSALVDTLSTPSDQY